MSKPNVLILYSDQFNARCISALGHPDVKTPNLDRLCKRGVTFTNAFAQNPVCTPSRISFLTGLYPSTHGYYGLYGRDMEPHYSNVFSHFSKHGYRCGALGKLHTPRYWIEKDCQFIYDEFIEFPKYLEGAGLYELNDNRKFTGLRDGKASTLPLEHSCEAALVSQFKRFEKNLGEPLDRGDSEAPWLAWVSFARPHSPITPSEPFASMYDPEKITLPPSADRNTWKNLSEWSSEVPGIKTGPDQQTLRNMVAKYLGVVSQVDWGIGQILDYLEQNNALDNTIIIFTADHGDWAGEMGMWSKTGGIRGSGICRVPLIAVLPDGEAKGVVCDEIIEIIDVFPTLCDVSAIPMKTPLQGFSFENLIHGGTEAIRKDALTENAERKALTTKKWRFLSNLDGLKDELFDRENDPWETCNLIDDPANTEIRMEMSTRLLRRLAQARSPVVGYDKASWSHIYSEDGFSLSTSHKDYKNSL
jgi:arylsulfatase